MVKIDITNNALTVEQEHPNAAEKSLNIKIGDSIAVVLNDDQDKGDSIAVSVLYGYGVHKNGVYLDLKDLVTESQELKCFEKDIQYVDRA